MCTLCTHPKKRVSPVGLSGWSAEADQFVGFEDPVALEVGFVERFRRIADVAEPQFARVLPGECSEEAGRGQTEGEGGARFQSRRQRLAGIGLATARALQ